MSEGCFNRQKRHSAKGPAKSRHWIRRGDVVFDEANNHNPLLPDECSSCRGSGRRSELDYDDESGTEAISRVSCADCGGTGTTSETVRYFDNEMPVADVLLRGDGWITCPCCGWSFSTADKSVWTGLRHVRCGQHIRPVGDVPH